MKLGPDLQLALQQAVGDLFPRATACFVASWLIMLAIGELIP